MDGTIRNYEVIAAIIILTREILISGLREFLAKGKIKLPVSNLAKLKTVLQMVSIALLLSGDTGNKIVNFQDLRDTLTKINCSHVIQSLLI